MLKEVKVTTNHTQPADLTANYQINDYTMRVPFLASSGFLSPAFSSRSMVQMLTALACAGGLAAVFTTMLTGLKNTKDAARLWLAAGAIGLFS